MIFSHRLAERLGYVDVERMLASIPYWKLQRWEKFYRLEGFGDKWPAKDDSNRTQKSSSVYHQSSLVDNDNDNDNNDDDGDSDTYTDDLDVDHVPSNYDRFASGLLAAMTK